MLDGSGFIDCDSDSVLDVCICCCGDDGVGGAPVCLSRSFLPLLLLFPTYLVVPSGDTAWRILNRLDNVTLDLDFSRILNVDSVFLNFYSLLCKKDCK